MDRVPGLNGDTRDMGVTTAPKLASPPGLKLSVFSEGNGWKVRCVLTPAVEGTNQAFYLAAGTYPSGIAWWADAGGYGTADDNHTEIYAILDETNADWSRRAELEHCNDWLRAHELTLVAAERTIRYAIPGLENRRFSSRVAAYAGALEAFVAHAPHQRIAAVFQASLVATHNAHDFYPLIFKSKLIELFLEIGDLTGTRDSNYWHHFEYSATVPNSQLGWIDWFSANSRDYRRVQRSATFQVGITPTNQLITL